MTFAGKILAPDLKNPFLPLFRKSWWKVGLIGLLGLSGVIQLILIGVYHEDPRGEAKVIMIGDPILAIFMAIAAHVLRSFEPPKTPRLWYTKIWLVGWAVVGMVFNYFWNDRPNFMAAGLFYQVHFAQVAVFTAIVMGVTPHIFEVKGHMVSKIIACAAIGIYIATLFAR